MIRKDACWLREKLAKGGRIFGSHIFCGVPMLSELMASIGFDVIWIDMEHTGLGSMDVLQNLIAVKAGGACSLVRIPWNDPVLAKPILDMGPDVLLFPNIRSLDEAKQAVQACEYPPLGVRGYGPQRAFMYGECSQMEYVSKRCRHMLRAIQIEHIGAVRDLEAIAQLPGIDLFIVGPNDLSGSMGKLGHFEDPEVQQAFDTIGEVLTQCGKPFGVSLGYDPDMISQWIARGAQAIFAGCDSGYVREGAQRVLNGLDTLVQPR